jgi:hypothetical protein
MRLISNSRFFLILPLALALCGQPIFAEEDDTNAGNAGIVESTEAAEEAYEDTESGALDDSTGSIESVHDAQGIFQRRGWNLSGDLRAGYVRSETENPDGSQNTSSDWRARLRYGGTRNINDWLVFNSRLAVACTSKECDPELSLDPSETAVLSVDQGTITFDELYLHAYRTERFDVAVGRLQTKFTTHAGVFAKSLDRNNSNAFNINWTDGVHGAIHLSKESTIH